MTTEPNNEIKMDTTKFKSIDFRLSPVLELNLTKNKRQEILLLCTKYRTFADNTKFGSFIIKPLNIGEGITIGNMLRRLILTNIDSSPIITGVRINNLIHEFQSINGCREDLIEILLNLKKLNLATHIFQKNKIPFKTFASLNEIGPKIITAGLFNFPKNSIKIINPQTYICTISNNCILNIELDIQNKTNSIVENSSISEYSEKVKLNLQEQPTIIKQHTFNINSLNTSVENINFNVKLIFDIFGNIKESVLFNLKTNGTITPKYAIFSAFTNIIDLSSSILNSILKEITFDNLIL